MPEKSPETYSLVTYAWVIGLAAWGGITNHLARVKAGKRDAFSIVELIGEMATSGFAGVLAFYACEASGIGALYAAVIVGISGHMGGRALYLMEEIIKHRLGTERGDRN